MRISFALPGHARKPGGGYRVIYTYASALASRGHEVVVTHGALLSPSMYARRLNHRREVKNVARGVIDLATPSRGRAWFDMHPGVEMRYVPSLTSRSLPRADATVATAWRTADAVASARWGGTGFYFIQHHEVWDGPAWRVDATWRLPLHKIVIAAWLEEVAARLGVGPVRRIPNAIDLDTFRLVRPIDGRGPRVAMLWSGAPVKGGDVGLRAMEEAGRLVPGFEAVLFGVGGPPRRLPAGVTYARNPPQDMLVREVYNESSVYLCPSWSEGWHLPPAEAMACGCAVVSTDIDGVRDYAIHGKTALLSPPGDAAALAANLVAVLSDDARRVTLATAAHDAISRFSWADSVDQFEAALVDGVGGAW